jgi:hypothetical protein
MGMIVSIHASQHIRDAIPASGIAAVHAGSIDEAIGLIPTFDEGPALFVLSTNSSSAALDGAALLGVAPSAQLLVLLPAAELSRFRAGLPFMPQLGRAWSASTTAASAELRKSSRMRHRSVAPAGPTVP